MLYLFITSFHQHYKIHDNFNVTVEMGENTKRFYNCIECDMMFLHSRIIKLRNREIHINRTQLHNHNNDHDHDDYDIVLYSTFTLSYTCIQLTNFGKYIYEILIAYFLLFSVLIK